MNTLLFDAPPKLGLLPANTTFKGRSFKHLFTALLLFYLIASVSMQRLFPMQPLLDQSIWQLVFLSIVCFTGITGLCWWLLNQF